MRRANMGAPRGVWLGFAALGAALIGCDDDDSGSRAYQAACDRTCQRAGLCSSSVDVAQCAEDCKDDLMDVGPNLRTDYLDGIVDCAGELSCTELFTAAVVDRCARDSRALIPPSTEAGDFCDLAAESIDMCTGISVGTSACLEQFKVIQDAILLEARPCFEQPCDQRNQCIADQLGLSLQ